MDDQWLAHKGKNRPPGPEERIGRTNLFGVDQPLGRKDQEGTRFDPRGDIYLEQIFLKGKKATKSLYQDSIQDVLQDRGYERKYAWAAMASETQKRDE